MIKSKNNEWIFSCNLERYLVVQAFTELGTIDWFTNKNVVKGDRVYIYLGLPLGRIALKTEVLEDMISPDRLIDDSKYTLGEFEKSYEGKYIRLKLLINLSSNNERLSYQHLLNNGLKGPIRGPIRLNNNIPLWDYIKSVENEPNIGIHGNHEIGEITKLDNLISLVLKDTEKQSLIKTRIGQGKFKKRLEFLGCYCRICGLKLRDLLIASHIKPWKDCTNEERLDINNGLLLCPIHDALFDKGYISFLRNGEILISPEIEEEQYKLLGISRGFNLGECSNNSGYLKWHRDKIFRE